MNINNFENYINKTILQRGHGYFNEGNIIETNNPGDNEFIFQVQGSEDYEVVVKLDENGEIRDSRCDCPYDFDSVCKHQVAAYFELFEMLNCKDDSEIVKNEAVKQPGIKEVLNNLSKEELIGILVDLAQKDTTLKNSLIFKYSRGDGAQELEKCEKLIHSIVRKYTGREGFIKYRETSGFVREMEELFEKVRDTDDNLVAIDIALLVLNEAMEAFQYADDSNGEIGSLVTEALELIEDIAMDSDHSETNSSGELFNKLLEQSERKIFDGWGDYKIELLRSCVKFADVEAHRKKLRVKIENMINKESDDHYVRYHNENMLLILLDMIDEYGTVKESEQFIKDNVTYTSFRKQLINKSMKEKHYHQVIELASEGEKQDKQWPGLLLKWKKVRYVAYKELSLKEELEKLARELLLDGNFEYYKDLKQFNTKNKDVFYNGLKQELKTDKGWHGRNVYLKLIVEENDLEEIMELVRGNPRNIEEYADMLVDKFNDEVIAIYQKHIKSTAKSSSNRRSYQEVCSILKRYKKIAGKKNQEEMINELSVLYKKRPAFVDELSKL